MRRKYLILRTKIWFQLCAGEFAAELNELQLRELKYYFSLDQSPSIFKMSKIARSLNVTQQTVIDWFTTQKQERGQGNLLNTQRSIVTEGQKQ